MVRDLGEKLNRQRNEHKMSQKQVASAIGVSPAVISNYENNERVPSIENLISLAKLFHCSTDYLLGLNQTKTDSSIDVSKLTSEQRAILQNFIDSL